LLNFYPAARAQDWKLIDAGIRVQAIKKEDGDAGIVHFGTEVVTTADKSISSLLGASPGASVCVNIVLEVIHKCFPALYQSKEGQKKLKEMIPTFDLDLGSIKEAEEIAQYQKWSQSAEGFLRLRK
ncbi:MAG: malate:quinone oxidoreductase, partial [Opitutae bacterium]